MTDEREIDPYHLGRLGRPVDASVRQTIAECIDADEFECLLTAVCRIEQLAHLQLSIARRLPPETLAKFKASPERYKFSPADIYRQRNDRLLDVMASLLINIFWRTACKSAAEIDAQFVFAACLVGGEIMVREMVLDDADPVLNDLEQRWKETGDPGFAWKALDLLSRDPDSSQPMPDWLQKYFAQSAARIMAAKGADWRDELPQALGFSMGKGGLRPSRTGESKKQTRDRYLLKIAFLHALLNTTTIDGVLDFSRNFLAQEDRDVDDKTLLRWMAKECGLTGTPHKLETWRQALISRAYEIADRLDRLPTPVGFAQSEGFGARLLAYVHSS